MTSVTVTEVSATVSVETTENAVIVQTAAQPSLVTAIVQGPQGPRGESGVGVATFSGGTTGLTPATAVNGAVTLGGTLVTGHGGTGTTSLTGYVRGTGSDALSAVPGIPADDISTPIDCGTFN